jgi:hypothetical protein
MSDIKLNYKRDSISTVDQKVMPARLKFKQNVKFCCKVKFPILSNLLSGGGLMMTNEEGYMEEGIDYERMAIVSNHRNKVWVVGSYKAGKTTILNILQKDDHFKPSPITNTKGIEYLVTDDYILVDTEGFNQPINTTEPMVKRDFVINHLRGWSDVIIFVVDRLMENDMIMLDRLLEITELNKQTIYLVHNVKSIKKEEVMMKYRDKVLIGLFELDQNKRRTTAVKSSDDIRVELANQEQLNITRRRGVFAVTQTFRGRPINHVFLGDLSSKSFFVNPWKSSFDDIRIALNNDSRNNTNYIKSIKESIESVVCKYYDLKTVDFDVHKHCLLLKGIENPKIIPGASDTYNQSKLLTSWYHINSNLIALIINACEFNIHEIIIKSNDTVMIRGAYRQFTRENAAIYTEQVFSPIPLIIVNQDIKDKTVSAYEVKGINGWGSWLIKLRANTSDFSQMKILDESSLALFHKPENADW